MNGISSRVKYWRIVINRIVIFPWSHFMSNGMFDTDNVNFRITLGVKFRVRVAELYRD